MGNIIKEMEMLKSKWKCPKSKTLEQMKNAFDGFISRLGMTEERINELEDKSIEISQKELQKE